MCESCFIRHLFICGYTLLKQVCGVCVCVVVCLSLYTYNCVCVCVCVCGMLSSNMMSGIPLSIPMMEPESESRKRCCCLFLCLHVLFVYLCIFVSLIFKLFSHTVTLKQKRIGEGQETRWCT